MNRNYVRGRTHEYAIKRKWEKDGWTVLRTAGSHGEFDLIAIKQNPAAQQFASERWNPSTPDHRPLAEIVFIQAKSGKSAKRERAKLEPLKAKYEGLYSVRVEIL